MGGAFSCGENNDDLVNILILLGYITSKKVERVFRAVDRGDYVLPSHRDLAYKDLSLKLGNIHLSAPCVYGKVMEGLTLKPGLSFLNIGSGTGYLSTMAGLILGKNGTNHGIEMHEDCLIYAYENLEIFKAKSLDVDSFEFCEPVFQLGNILTASPNRQYDRVYCGAACPENHEQYIKQFVKVGGILVMPYKDNLLRIERLNKNTWRNTTMLPVSFATLVTPPEDKERGILQLPLWQPYTLQELCRSSIRCHLRKLVWSENNDLEYKSKITAQPIERTVPQLHSGIPFFEESNPNPVQTQGQLNRDSAEIDDDEIHATQTLFHNIEGLRSAEVAEALARAVVHLYHGAENCEENPEEATMSDESAEIVPPASSESLNNASMESDDFMNAGSSKKEEKPLEANNSLDVEMDDCESDQNTATNTRPLDSKLKRKSEAIGSNAEAHNSQRYRLSDKNEVDGETSGVKAPTSTSEPPPWISDPEEPDEDNSLNYAWIKQAFSILKDKFETEMEQTSDSTSDTSDSSSEESESNEPLGTANYRVEVENVVADSDEEEESAWNNRKSRENGSCTFLAYNLYPKDGNGKKTVDFETVEDESEDTKLPDKSDSNSDSTSDEEFVRAEYRRSSRSGRKRRSEQRSDTSGSNESSNNTYASDCSDSTDLDTDFDFNFIHGRNFKRNTFAHTVRKEQISHFMQKKVSNLPLPLSLRLYVNYNREL